MRSDELPAYIARAEVGYALDLEHNGHMTSEKAREKARRDTESLFPAGGAADGQLLFVIEDGAGNPVGAVHYAERPPDSGIAWLYNIVVDESRRGRGAGRRAMELFEQDARARGYRRAELNVFGGNEVARGLYRALGYREIAVLMGKELETP